MRFYVLPVIVAFVHTAQANQPAVTVYNQNFAVVREHIDLDLQQGVNEIRYADTTAHVEPDSVILRDPAGKRRIQILEQNYRADPISQPLLLSIYEGQTIEFLLPDKDEPVLGKIIRSAYVPHTSAWQQYGQQYYYAQQARMANPVTGAGQPIIEIDGKLRFGLPGTPLFPSLADDTILKPTLHWLLETDAAGKLDAELSYVTGGMMWNADYNIVSPEHGDTLDLVGWVTIDNQSGKGFEQARIKLMAGDVSKIQPVPPGMYPYSSVRRSGLGGDMSGMAPPVGEKAFDEYHLYTVARPTTLHDRETKQVEFVRASGIQSKRLYVYDGLNIESWRYQGWDINSLRQNPDYGSQSITTVSVMREFENTEANNLGIPLPAGRVRFYRADDDGLLEFTGENEIEHTPKDETIRVYTGNAFDLVGERRRTDFQIDHNARWVDESFEIRVRNHMAELAEVRVVEHLYRWKNWEFAEKSQDFIKKDSQTIEFVVEIPPDGEKVVTYKAHYTW